MREHEGGLAKPRLLILGSQDVAKAAVVADMSESGVFEQRLQCTTNVADMSWPVRYGEVYSYSSSRIFRGAHPQK